jgi:hypothetical protein
VSLLQVASGLLRATSSIRVTLRIVRTSLFIFLSYLVIGVLLAAFPGYAHLHLGFSTFWAGIAVSSQYAATVLSRPKAGRMTDVLGPRTTVLLGQLACFLSGLLLLFAVSFEDKVIVCFGVLLMSRMALGSGESGVATGSATWGLGRLKSEYAAQDHFQRALQRAEAVPHRLEQAEVRRFHAMMLIDRAARGDRERARRLLSQACEIYRQIGMPRRVEMTQTSSTYHRARVKASMPRLRQDLYLA